MMTSSRLRDVGASFAQRRGHANTLSISDPSHHVTEAIGTLYGSDDDETDSERENRKSRPLSFVSYGEDALQSRLKDGEDTEDPRRALQRSASENSPLTSHDGGSATNPKRTSMITGGLAIQRTTSHENGRPPSPGGNMPPMSPTPSLRDMQVAESSMPMTNIDNPSDIAQELSNLQALRRMSMDVGNSSDPDLMPFQGIVPIPPIAPTGDDDEADPSRLLWVPANVHPELAPEQFKSFLERRVNSVKRRSGESLLSSEGLSPTSPGGLGGGLGSLRRTKSKLSRQIDNTGGSGADGYVDGAERLRRQNSVDGYNTPELSLEELVNDPTKAVQKLAQEASDGASGPGDMPILPVAPGMGLRRSTRTQYRKSGSLRGDRAPFSKRVARQSESQEESLPTMPKVDAPPGQGPSQVQSEPPRADNFSRPQKSIKRQQGFTRESASSVEPSVEQSSDDGPQQQVHGRSASESTAAPQVGPPPSADQTESSRHYPERASSHKARAQLLQDQPPPVPQHQPQERSEEHPPARAKQIPPGRQAITPVSLDNVPGPTQTMNDIANHPSAIPGSSGTRTDNLTFIPTFSDADKKKARDSDSESTKSSKGWKWFKSEDKKKEKEREEQSRRSKMKSTDKSHENARLDVLQNSIENVVSKGRESLLLDRDTIDSKLQEERKKESYRKSGEGKKEKDGFFGSIFGGKKKADKDAPSRKQQQRAASPEPPPRLLKPDVDYPYTRFPLLEERAIYRMAHIKLANPKRNLHSQVLLSNFMYSYLAKIQAMHPQIQVPVSPQQKRQEEERRRKEQEAQQAYMEQQQAQNSIDQYNFEYHRPGNQYGDSEGDYVDENQEPYDYEQGHGGYDQNGGYGYGHDAYGQQQYYEGHDPQRQDDDNMW